MIRVEHTVVIKRPIEEVFNFMAKVENLPRWAENTIEAQQTSQGPLGVQHDVYHMQIMEGDLARTIEGNLEAIWHVQLADNPGRNEPGTGEINYPYLFDHLDKIGYEGWLGCE